MASAYAPPLRTDRRLLTEALTGASRTSFWIEDTPLAALPPLTVNVSADLAIVGGGYAGLWTALLAKERRPDRSVVLLEGRTAGWAASGRNGGFMESSLTHGESNGELHFSTDLELLTLLAKENFEEIARTLQRYGIDAEFERTGMLQVATEGYQVAAIREQAHSEGEEFLDRDAVRGKVASPLFEAGVHLRKGIAMVHPMKLVAGLRRVCLELGVQIFENSPVRSMSKSGDGVALQVGAWTVRAPRVALATNAFPALLKRAELLTIPVYDYVLMSEPFSAQQLASIGWQERHGIADSSRQFHYYRLSADNRILFGGYDAVYHRGGRVDARFDSRPETFEKLADHFYRTFPQLEGTRFTHAWGGAIDMSARLTAHTASAWGGRVAYTGGYTGLGVGSTRFGAQIMLDLLEGADTVRTHLKMARSLPMPIPPEPIAYPAIQAARAAVARSDENGGRDGLLLKTMGLFGIGFDT